DRNIHVAEFFVASERSPCAGVARKLPGILAAIVLAPRLDAEFASLRDGMEGPQQFAGADVVTADVTGCVQPGRQCNAHFKRCADYGDVANDNRRRGRADTAWDNRGAVEVLVHIDMRVGAE